MPDNRQWRTGRHVVSALHVHLVFVTKHRCGTLNEKLHAVVKETATAVCRDFESELLEYEGESDHVHLLIAYPPKISISRLVNSLKGVTSRKLRKDHYDEIRDKLWGASFWSPSYCAISNRGASLDTVEAYIRKQQPRQSSRA